MKRNFNKCIWAMALLCVIALTFTVMMTLHSLSGAHLAGCSAGSSCDTVLGSRWSLILGFFPVSGLALAVYIAVASCLGFIAFSDDDGVKDLAWKVLLLSSGVITGSAVWMVILQKWIVEAFCPYCMSAHMTGIVFSVICVIACPEKRKKSVFLPLACGFSLAAGLAGFQLLTTAESDASVGRSGAELPVVDINAMPVVGDVNAPHVIELLFDYQCSHCQKIHSMLPEVVESYSGQVAFVLVPTPLSLECNPYVPRGVQDRFQGSCELARIAMALWKLDRKAFWDFDQWIFHKEADSKWMLRGTEAAREFAKAKVEAGTLEKLTNSPEVISQISMNLEIFARTSNNEVSAIPRFVYKDKWFVPDTDSADGLKKLLDDIFFIAH